MTDQNSTTSPEIFKPIPDFPGYEVSNLGLVRSYWKRGRRRWFIVSNPQRVLKPAIRLGYPSVTLVKNGLKTDIGIHRLVLLTFIGPCPPTYECCHDDGIRANCSLDNLRWDSRSSNAIERFKHGNSDYKGENHPQTKLTDEQILQIRKFAVQGNNSQTAIAALFGISQSHANNIIRRRAWKHLP